MDKDEIKEIGRLRKALKPLLRSEMFEPVFNKFAFNDRLRTTDKVAHEKLDSISVKLDSLKPLSKVEASIDFSQLEATTNAFIEVAKAQIADKDAKSVKLDDLDKILARLDDVHKIYMHKMSKMLLTDPKDPKSYLNVRLTDGEDFYKAATRAIAAMTEGYNNMTVAISGIDNVVVTNTVTVSGTVNVGNQRVSISGIDYTAIANFPTIQAVQLRAMGSNGFSAPGVSILGGAKDGAGNQQAIRANVDGTQIVTISGSVAQEYGTWGYSAGISGSVSLVGAKRILAITAHCTTAGTVTINGGTPIPVAALSALSIEPKGNLVDPSIIFTTTDSYFVEYVT